MRTVSSLLAGFGLLLWVSLARAGGAFEGKFSDGKLTAQWTEGGAAATGDYSGTISLGDQKFQSTGHADGQVIDGTFVAGANRFAFKGTLEGETLTFVTGGATYTLAKQSAAVNPLAGGQAQQPVNPLTASTVKGSAEGANAGEVPSGYSVVSTTDMGRAMSTHKGEAKTVKAALQATLPELAHYFDGRPTIVRADEDTQDQSTGGVSFTAKLKGQPVNGWVSCQLAAPGGAEGRAGASVAVIYCNASATAADWKKLMASGREGGATGGSAGGAAEAASVPLHAYPFPDGTGSIGLADGWTTNSPSCHGTVVINGPADQVITMGLIFSVVTPNSTAVRMNQQLNANARQMGGRPMPLGLFVAPYDNPLSALKNLTPQASEKSRENGGPTFEIDHLTQLRTIRPALQNGTAAVANYGITVSANGEQKHRLALSQLEMDPISNDSYMFCLASAAAPDATYKQDLPVMLKIMNSLHENAAVIQQQTRQQIDGMNQRFAAQQRAQQTVQQGYDDYNKGVEHNELVQERSNTDFDEVIRGTRTVEDTQTGDRTSVNLGDSSQIVDNLNQYQPGRYKEIPLRDEMYPLPAGPDGQ